MTWAKFDDQLYTHPKLAALGHYALPCMGLNLLAVCWSNSTLTDGHIPSGQIFKLCGDIELLVPSGKPWELVNPMLDAGVWDECGTHTNCYVVHDFLDYNPSRADVLALRKARAEAGSVGGKRSSKTQAKGKQTPQQKVTPVPEPVPSVSDETQTPPTPSEGVAARVFEVWRVETRHLGAKFTAQRRRAVQARLREGYSEADLTDAVRGVALDPWPERVHHNDLAVICRDGAHVEKFRDLWRNPHPVVAIKRNPIDERIANFGSGLSVTA